MQISIEMPEGGVTEGIYDVKILQVDSGVDKLVTSRVSECTTALRLRSWPRSRSQTFLSVWLTRTKKCV